MKIKYSYLFILGMTLLGWGEGFSSNFDPPVTSLTENPDVESQVKGDYPPLERQESLPLGAIQHAWDKGGKNLGVYVVTHHPREIIKIRAREMMTTTVIFPKWERIEEVFLGDEGSFKATIHGGNMLLIRPLDLIGIDTSLTAIGASGKVYGFYLRCEGYNSKNVSDLKVYVKVPTPLGAPKLPPQKNQKDYLEDVPFDPSKLVFNFSMAGSRKLAPKRIYSDGIRTWFDYGNEIQTQNLPVIYAVLDGVDTPLNVTRVGNRLVTAAHNRYSLKNGRKVTCVWRS